MLINIKWLIILQSDFADPKLFSFRVYYLYLIIFLLSFLVTLMRKSYKELYLWNGTKIQKIFVIQESIKFRYLITA